MSGRSTKEQRQVDLEDLRGVEHRSQCGMKQPQGLGTCEGSDATDSLIVAWPRGRSDGPSSFFEPSNIVQVSEVNEARLQLNIPLLSR